MNVLGQTETQAGSRPDPKRHPRKCDVDKNQKWKIGTNLATTTGDNASYSQLTKTRTGWGQRELLRYIRR